MRLREEEMARLHQEAIAESAAHASELEASISSSSSSDLQTISKSVSADKESKPEENNEYVWHPYVIICFCIYRLLSLLLLLTVSIGF
jgi:hypothetical protein